jgi:hypothetical protein
MPPSASLCSCSSGAVLARSRGRRMVSAAIVPTLRSGPYALFSWARASGLRPPRAQAGRASLALRPHQDPLALATHSVAADSVLR